MSPSNNLDYVSFIKNIIQNGRRSPMTYHNTSKIEYVIFP